MIVNGRIEIMLSGGTGLDASGDPVASETIWGDPLECHIISVKNDKKGVYADGKFQQSSFEILIGLQEVEAEIVRLTNEFDELLGEFQIQDIQYLNYVGEVKIIV